MKCLPEIFKNIRKIEILSKRAVKEILSGSYRSAFKGRGMEFEEVREYQPGDDVRSIDWNVTARFQTPYVKSYREERELNVTLLVDVSASSLFGTTGKKKAELIAETAALLAFSAAKNQDKTSLILFSNQVEKYLPLKKGQHNVMRMIRELLVYKPQGKSTDLKEALTFLGKVQKRPGVVFVISDFFTQPFDKELARVCKRHEVIGINVRDPKEMLLPRMGIVQLRDLETQKMMLVDTRSQKVQKMIQKQAVDQMESFRKLFERIGDGWLNIRSDQPHLKAIVQYLKKRQNNR